MRAVLKPLGWILLAAGAVAAQGTVTLDRIAVIVGNHVIKTSDIDLDLRLTAFLNRQPLDRGATAKKPSAERLIDQQLIRDEIANGSYRRPTGQEAESLETQLVRDRFKGSEKALDKELAQYDLTREQLSIRLLWQLTVLRFIDQRFRAGVLVSDTDAQQYVQQHMAELRRNNPGASSEVLDSKARDILEGEEVNRNFTDWLEQVHKRTRIEYK